MGKTFSSPLVHNVLAPPSGGDSVLKTLADGLSVGAAKVELDISGSFSSTWVNYENFNYGYKLVWDPVAKKLHGIFKRQQSRGNLSRYIVYDEATNTWTNPSNEGPDATWGGTPYGWIGGRKTGHAYHGLTVDTAAGRTYFNPYNSSMIFYFSPGAGFDNTNPVVTGTGVGSDVPIHPDWPPHMATSWSTSSVSGPYGLEYHPNLYGTGDGGFIVCGSQTIRALRKSTGTWNTLLSTGLVYDNHTVGIYSSALNSVMTGTGDASPAMFIIIGGSTPSVFRVADAPAGFIPSVNPNNNMARLVTTPGGNFMLMSNLTGECRIWNSVTDTWDAIADLHPFADGYPHWHIGTIPELDIFIAMTPVHNTAELLPKVHVWKPPAVFQAGASF